MRVNLDAIQRRYKTYTESWWGRRVLKAARIAFVTGVVGYLVWKLRDVDLDQVVAGLPASIEFYLLLLLAYFILPAAQILAYRVTWSFPLRHGIPAFVKKRILNKDVLGYSGEVFLFSWATKYVREPPVELAKTIRDQNIVSAAASTIVTIVLVIVFIFTGQVTLSDLVGHWEESTIIVGGLVLAVVMTIMVRIWKWVFAMPFGQSSKVFSVHVARVLVRQVAEIMMWHIAMPEVPLKVWFTYAAVTIIVTRIPLVPAQDLLIMGVAVGLSDALGVPKEHILALFGAVAVVYRGINVLVFALLPMMERQKQRHGDHTPPDGD